MEVPGNICFHSGIALVNFAPTAIRIDRKRKAVKCYLKNFQNEHFGKKIIIFDYRKGSFDMAEYYFSSFKMNRKKAWLVFLTAFRKIANFKFMVKTITKKHKTFKVYYVELNYQFLGGAICESPGKCSDPFFEEEKGLGELFCISKQAELNNANRPINVKRLPGLSKDFYANHISIIECRNKIFAETHLVHVKTFVSEFILLEKLIPPQYKIGTLSKPQYFN